MKEQGLHPILLYDGVCGFCNRTVRYILKRDRQKVFRFASLQSELARGILTKHGASPSDLDTFYVVLDFNVGLQDNIPPNEKLLARSDAVIFVLREIGGVSRWAGNAFRLVNRGLRDWIYNVIARRRYRFFGRYETCPLPDPETRDRFLDV